MSSKLQDRKLKMISMRGPVFELDPQVRKATIYQKIGVYAQADSRLLVRTDTKADAPDEVYKQ